MDISLDFEQRLFFRDQLRSARAAALLDAEGFAPIVEVLERLGAMLFPAGKGLGHFRKSLLAVASHSAVTPRDDDDRGTFTPLEVLFTAVQNGRNDAVHQGAYVRHLVRHCLELALLVEGGLMAGSKCVADFMVRNPACAEPWQQLALARQQMLTHSYSYLPVRIDLEWQLLSDHSVALFIASSADPSRALRQRIDIAARDNGLMLETPTVVSPDLGVKEALERSNGRPMLVQEDGRLLGIATPFDFL